MAAFGVIKELIALLRLLLNWVDAHKQAEADKRQQELEKAVDDQKAAQTEEEFDNAQDGIVRNKP